MVSDFGFAADSSATVSGGTIIYAATELLEAKLAEKEFKYLPCHDLISAVKLLWVINRKEDTLNWSRTQPTRSERSTLKWQEGVNFELKGMLSLARKGSYDELAAYYEAMLLHH